MKRFFGSTVGVVLGCAVMGCAIEIEEGVSSKEQAAVGDHYVVYSFSNGAWATRDYTWPNATTTVTAQNAANSFGQAGDIPFIWEPRSNSASVQVGTYRPSDGKFYLDRDGNRVWGGSDTGIVFMTPQSGDLPFVLTAAYWAGSGGSACGKLSGFQNTGPMVGIKRGTSVFLDRTGDGVFTPGSCDLSNTAGLGLSGDIPAGVSSGAPNATWEHVFALTRKDIGAGTATWFFDNNTNLQWVEPPDFTSSVNAFGDAAQKFPPSHPDCIATGAGSGTTVYHDTNCDRIWNPATDIAYLSAMPGSSWILAGVDLH